MKNTFSVCDRKIAYRLLKEGFECVKVKPSNKEPDECRMVFYFVGSEVFIERFHTILKEELAKDKKVLKEKCEKSASDCENTSENGEKSSEYAHICAMLDKIFDHIAALNFAYSARNKE